MSEPLPIACTLRPADMPQRAADIRALGRDALLTAECSGREAVLRFRFDRVTRARLEKIVAAEAECCAFMDFDRSVTEDAIKLTVTAPDGAEAAVHLLAGLFAGSEVAACGTKRNGRSAFTEAAGRLGPRVPRQVRDAP